MRAYEGRRLVSEGGGADRTLLAPPRNSGAPLPAASRAFFEPRLGGDFSRVRVHTDENARALTAGLGARALTADNNVYFKEGTYAPDTLAGRRLLAHELTHVVQHRRRGAAPASRPVSRSGDAAEREADVAARVVTDGDRFEARATPDGQVSRDDDKSKDTTPPLARGSSFGPSPLGQPPGPPPQSCFEEPSARTAAGAPAAFDKFLALKSSERQTVLSITYASGSLSGALAALGASARDAKYATVVKEILRWIEETETRKTTGKSDADMAKLQAGVITKDQKPSNSNWGGETKSTTRWGELLKPARDAWTERAGRAATKMAAYGATKAPELSLTAATFEFDPEKLDRLSKFAYGAGGSKSGETVLVGFEFVTQVEADPGYVLSTVAHELRGHPAFDDASGRSYQGELFTKAAALTPAGTVTDATGAESFDYWSSELYSSLVEIPYFKPTAAADVNKPLVTPGFKTTVGTMNADPAKLAEKWLRKIKAGWEPSLGVGVMRGFYKRLQNDPAIAKVAVTAFEGMVKAVFGAADAATILK